MSRASHFHLNQVKLKDLLSYLIIDVVLEKISMRKTDSLLLQGRRWLHRHFCQLTNFLLGTNILVHFLSEIEENLGLPETKVYQMGTNRLRFFGRPSSSLADGWPPRIAFACAKQASLKVSADFYITHMLLTANPIGYVSALGETPTGRKNPFHQRGIKNARCAPRPHNGVWWDKPGLQSDADRIVFENNNVKHLKIMAFGLSMETQ